MGRRESRHFRGNDLWQPLYFLRCYRLLKDVGVACLALTPEELQRHRASQVAVIAGVVVMTYCKEENQRSLRALNQLPGTNDITTALARPTMRLRSTAP